MYNRLFFGDYGIRADNKKYEIGDILPVSRVWADNQATDYALDGTSTIDARLGAKKVRKLIKSYGKHNYYYIVKGQAQNAGEDEGELIIKNAVVVKIIKIKF